MERDTRPLGEIQFAADLPYSSLEHASIEAKIRDYLHQVGVGVGQDIIEMGCTGLAQALNNLYASESAEGSHCSLEQCAQQAIATASFILQNMAGSICGLPCYVPRDRYCLVHDTIGGLQLEGNLDGPQMRRHPEALPLMSRELTEDERKHVGGIKAKIAEEARRVALAEYGVEDIEDEGNPAPSCPVPPPPFECPEHKEKPDWTCRKCLAQSLVDSGSVTTEVRSLSASIGWDTEAGVTTGLNRLERGDVTRVELWVRVASWSKKVTRD